MENPACNLKYSIKIWDRLFNSFSIPIFLCHNLLKYINKASDMICLNQERIEMKMGMPKKRY